MPRIDYGKYNPIYVSEIVVGSLFNESNVKQSLIERTMHLKVS